LKRKGAEQYQRDERTVAGEPAQHGSLPSAVTRPIKVVAQCNTLRAMLRRIRANSQPTK